MKDKSTLIGAALAALALVVIVIGIVLFFFGGSGETLPSPEEVQAKLPSLTPEEQEKLVLSLGRYDEKDPRSESAVILLRKMVKDTSISPQGRAAAIRALGSKRDVPCLIDVAECLYLDDDKDYVVRKAAVEACNQIMLINLPYDPGATPEDRRRPADDYMANAKLWHKIKLGDKAGK